MALLEQAIMGQNTPQTALTQGQAQSQARMQSILPQAQQAQKYNAGLQPANMRPGPDGVFPNVPPPAYQPPPQAIPQPTPDVPAFENNLPTPPPPARPTDLRTPPPAPPNFSQDAASYLAQVRAAAPQQFGTNNAIVRLR